MLDFSWFHKNASLLQGIKNGLGDEVLSQVLFPMQFLQILPILQVERQLDFLRGEEAEHLVPPG